MLSIPKKGGKNVLPIPKKGKTWCPGRTASPLLATPLILYFTFGSRHKERHSVLSKQTRQKHIAFLTLTIPDQNLQGSNKLWNLHWRPLVPAEWRVTWKESFKYRTALIGNRWLVCRFKTIFQRQTGVACNKQSFSLERWWLNDSSLLNNLSNTEQQSLVLLINSSLRNNLPINVD